MKVELIKDFTFEAAHRMPERGEAAARLHGHSYRAGIQLEGETDPARGWFIDFGDIGKAFEPLRRQLDHRYLNDVDGMDDVSMEGIAAWIEARLAPSLPGLQRVYVEILGDEMFKPVSLSAEPARSWPARVRFGFEAAHCLPALPAEHKCSRIHGHSFRVEVGADHLQGLETHLQSVYDALDHRYLNDIPGLENATSENLCGWIWERLAREVGDLRVVIVQETCTARCIYRGE